MCIPVGRGWKIISQVIDYRTVIAENVKYQADIYSCDITWNRI
jgi:hypothetical protein